MGIELWVIGKTKEGYLREGIADYEKRCGRYLKLTTVVIQEPKNGPRLPPAELKKQEAAGVLRKLQAADHLILLDEGGDLPDSRKFSKLLEKRMAEGRRTVFLIGGPYGFDDALYRRSQMKLSLSRMTFSHQLVRLLFWEQVYRGLAIINGLPYHND